MKEEYKAIAAIAILLLAVITTSSFPLANGQPEQQPLPVLLMHDYVSDALVWKTWKELLRNDNIVAHAVAFADDPITFADEDQCGSAEAHASELNQLIEDFKSNTRSEMINIVAHSKGGLDARVYLANNLLNDDIANLIMIGTPNAGSPLAEDSNFCAPAVDDLRPGSPTTVKLNTNTKHYTITGSWVSIWLYWQPLLTYIDMNCPPSPWLSYELSGTIEIQGPHDGIVPVSSVNPGDFTSFGQTDNCHTNLFGYEEYEKAREVLLR